ncbi:MMPL family transporter [Flavitalea sp. BT771]|uniref:efflux RND transporter permease subunit n=1 Tax=Flavitalea sp. BT771 TaxID=3063329 RepID=UPI0026E32495|nr:MMPL family transporter [Flavitalea sp. BT771]MDO6433781.1 MMPL family transporter [Flavitalea sp. BT771]MDV6222314.1 MMPL family transporter [Flavitalea sp. BT771]
MWESLARLVLKFRLSLLLFLLTATGFMAYHASRVKLSYDFNSSIPTDNPKYIANLNFRQQFGDDGNLLVVGVQTDRLFEKEIFSGYIALGEKLKKITGVDDVLSTPMAINLVKDSVTEKPHALAIFPAHPQSQAEIDSGKSVFKGLPFYKGLLYNAETNTWLMAVRVNKDVMNSAKRIVTVNAIIKEVKAFGTQYNLDMHLSGLPLIRTVMAQKVSRETTWFLLGSVLLSAIILVIFFRSLGAMLLSLGVVIVGVIFSLGTMDLLGYKITLLNALTPTLMVVIGIPNCIYFLNKYHTAYRELKDKREALLAMIGRMGVVTLFCNLTAAIGFGVFALTRSAILNQFGVVAGINIMMLFFISFILIPVVLSYLPPPRPHHTRYLENRWLTAILRKLEIWTLHHQRTIYAVTFGMLVLAIVGMFRLKSEGFIVDDLPQKDPIYTDLKFFEHHFKGVMPLEIIVDTRRKNGLRINMLQTLDSVDQLSRYIAAQPEMARPLSLAEGLKFVRQSYYGGDSANYGVPNSLDLPFLSSYLKGGGDSSGKATGGSNNLNQLLKSFVDKDNRRLRISVNMADVGSSRLPFILDDLERKTKLLFDTAKYHVELTGTSVTYLEGSSFIIKGLKDSIQWAFVLIAACMLFLFRSFRILLCSLVPNIIPLIITAGIMGWAGVRLKPSTVIIFSIALGIAIDITIRFLVNYKQESRGPDGKQTDPQQMVIETINKTGISILYTSMVLIAGFVIFCFSDFGGIFALGWLTSLTLVIATVTNLVFLPALLITLTRRRRR